MIDRDGNPLYGGRGIVLDITEEIINAAVTRDSSHCVIADALRAAVPTARYVSVDLQTIRFSDRETGKRFIYLTPAFAQRILVDFDQGITPRPQSRNLGRPAQIMKMNQNQKSNADVAGLPRGARKRLAKPDKSEAIPTVLGGGYPPTAALSSTRGRRRAFGLRSLKP